jgi:hypothetical protein
MGMNHSLNKEIVDNFKYILKILQKYYKNIRIRIFK